MDCLFEWGGEPCQPSQARPPIHNKQATIPHLPLLTAITAIIWHLPHTTSNTALPWWEATLQQNASNYRVPHESRCLSRNGTFVWGDVCHGWIRTTSMWHLRHIYFAIYLCWTWILVEPFAKDGAARAKEILAKNSIELHTSKNLLLFNFQIAVLDINFDLFLLLHLPNLLHFLSRKM